MDNINDINSYNSITMSQSIPKEKRVSTSYSFTKINLTNELSKTLKTLDANPFKKVSIELHNNLQRTSINKDKVFTNTQNISTKEEDSSSSTLTKLPKIQNHINSNTITGSQYLTSNNFFSNENNSIKYTQKDYASLSDANTSISNAGKILNNSNYPNSTKNRSSFMGSANRIYGSHPYKNKNYDSIISPPDPLLKRTVVPKVNPRFGKMKQYIPLPDFKGEEPFTKFEYKPIMKEMLTTPSIEKQYEVSLYINSNKMLNNLIYLKTQLNKDGLISLENLVNVKKLNKYYKNEDEEEEEIMQIDPVQNNYSGGTLENNGINNKDINLNNFQDNNAELLINGNKQYEEENSINNNEQKDGNNNINNNKFLKTGNLANDNNNKYLRPKTVYNELKPYYTLKNKNDNTLIFESRFESGNLLCAFRTEDENCYQLYLQNDTNTTGYIQWFFFRVSNTKKGRKVNFNIINMLRKTCVYNHGLKIMTYSTTAAAKENLGWHRDCFNSIYYANNLFVYNNNNASKKRNLHSLSFDYEFKYDNDTVYFANCIPYFYSTLMKELNKYELDDEKYPFFYRKTLTVTLGGNDLDMFTINSMYDIFQNGATSVVTQKSKNYLYIKNTQENNNNNLSQVLDERKAVVIIGRQHPGETVGSYVVKGCIDFLMGDSEEAKKLREVYVFKIVPMMNPDGVLVGNSRTSFAGCDLNRRWGKPNEIIHPEVYSTKQMITKLSNQRNIAFIIDCHGHFGTFNSLFYCNYKDNKRTCKLFPYICSKLSKIINFQQCTFAMPRYKLTTERIVLFNELAEEDNNNIVALETSFFGINRNGEYSHLYFNTTLLKEIGRDVCLGMLSYYYKYENISLDSNLLNSKDIPKKLDVDMREFEDEIIREVNEEDEDIEIVDEKSESEPSVDNLDKNQIMKLMPTNGKKRRRKKTNKFKKFDKKKDNKNRDLNIELYNPIKEAAKKMEEERKKKIKNSKIIINCNFKTKKSLKRQSLITDTNMKNEYTQTEEIFFKMHWSYFSGQYKIMSSNKFGDYLNSNNFDISSNLFGQLKRSNFYKKQIDENLRTLNRLNGMNPVTRAKSFNNKIILNKKNSIFLNGINNNMNIIANKKFLNNKNNINTNDNEQKNNIDNHEDLGEENGMKMINNQNNKLFNFTIDNNSNNDIITKKFKKNFSPFSINLTKNKPNGINNPKENGNTNKNFLSTKYNNFNNKSYKDNIKLKMAKSSTSFYKK